MEDTSSSSSDSDNNFLAPNDMSRRGCNAATQTPEMSRHNMPHKHPPKADLQKPKPSIVVYKLDTQKPMSELQKEAKTLAIPDVVVEYIRDNLQDELGTSNPAFESSDVIIVRTPSMVSLREDSKEAKSLSLIGDENRRLYYSMPKSLRNRSDDPKIHSQNATPKIGRLLNVAVPSPSASTSSLGYPRSIPPSPNFGYRPLESETSAVYTIIAPVRYMESGNEKENDMQMLADMQQEKSSLRKFEFNPAPAQLERKRKRLQCLTDTCSMMFLIPGLLIAIITPICLIPMFLLPLTYYIPLIGVFVFSGCVSVVALAFSGLMGNIVWHYDPNKDKIRLRLHCGRGPLTHYWGNAFYYSKEDRQPLQKDLVV